MKVSNLYISRVKRKCGIEVGKEFAQYNEENGLLTGQFDDCATDLELVQSPDFT